MNTRFLSQLTITDGRRSSVATKVGAGFHVTGLTNVRPEQFAVVKAEFLVVQPQAKLNRAWLVALSVDSTKTRRTVESVRITEVRAIEDISELSFKPEVQFLLDWKDLEYVDVFVVGGESAY